MAYLNIQTLKLNSNQKGQLRLKIMHMILQGNINSLAVKEKSIPYLLSTF